MTGAYVYTPAIWPPLAAALFLAAIGLHCWRRRSAPAALPLLAVSLFGVLWLLGIALEAAAVADATKIAWFKFQSIWRAPTATAGLCFVLEYAYPGRWLTRRNLGLLTLPVLLDILLIVINDSQFMWRRLEVGPDGLVVADLAPAGVIMAVYGVGLVLVNTAVLLWLFIRSPQHRWPVAVILFGQIASRALYVVDAAHLSWLAPIDPFTFAVFVGSTTYAIALFGFHIFDPLPAARTAALEQMRDGMIAFDPQWRIAALNRAAASILGASAARARGKRLAEVLPAFGDLSARLVSGAASVERTEVTLGAGPGASSYEINVSPLRDFRGLLVGHLLLLHDVTEQRRAQAQLLAQRWAQATLEEREQLAYELHDSLSQSLAFLNMQAQAAQLYLEREQDADAQASVARLAEVSREMQGDVRDLIGSLLAVSLPSEGFCATLRHIASDFEKQNGMPVCLDIDNPATALCGPSLLPASTGVQLIRIVQEALANVRKHASGPNQVSIQLRVEAGQLRLAITDNGAGFDPDATGADGRHFGLQVMHRRAERVGGQLAVHAAPGQGTCVEVCVPLGNGEGGWQHEDPPG
jgi:PAS domain S-box-containing protein